MECCYLKFSAKVFINRKKKGIYELKNNQGMWLYFLIPELGGGILQHNMQG